MVGNEIHVVRRRHNCLISFTASEFTSSNHSFHSKGVLVGSRGAVVAYVLKTLQKETGCDYCLAYNMESLSVYHGAITKDATERLLGSSGKDGSFLIRNSETIPGVYCLCVLFNECVYTYRLHRTPGEAWIVEASPGSQKRLFRNVKNLIAAFEKPDQGIVMPLLYPVHAEKKSYQLNGR